MNKVFFIAVLTLCGTLAIAKDTVPAAGESVQAIVTVEAVHAKSVPALAPEDFMVFQGRNRLRVDNVLPCQGDHAGLELYLLLDDASGSSLGSQLEDLRKFIAAQPSTTAIGVGYMRNGTVNIVENLTTNHAQAAKSLRLPLASPTVMASPFLSLSDLIKRWPANGTRHEVLMVASGVDALGGEIANPYLDTAIEQAQRNGIIVYGIYTPGAGHAGHSFWQMNWGQNHLAQLAEETGGEAYFLGFGPPVSFAPYLENVAERLSHQFLVTFVATPGEKAGFQSIKITTEVPNAELVSARRVYMPAAK